VKTRKLGDQGLEVSAQGLGCMGMSEFYGVADEREAIATIHRAYDLGVRFLDTADMYGPFRNEQLVGQAIAGRRDDFVVATKFSILRGGDGSFAGVCGKPEYVHEACNASLTRLGIDHILTFKLEEMIVRFRSCVNSHPSQLPPLVGEMASCTI